MKMYNVWSWLAAMIALLGLANTASAQQFQPFIDPAYFNPDLQFFAPAEVDYYGDPAPPTTGWFFTYDRLYWSVTRPENGTRPWDGDFTWGNRFDMGYMTEDDGGWLFSGTHVDGPTGGAGSYKAALASVELNKVWRWDPLHHNGIIEPFIGVRFVQFNDYGSVNDPFVTPQHIKNNIVAGQLGVRTWKNVGHWKLSAELRAFNGVNFQMYETEDFSEFVPAGEVRTEMQYNLTRDVALRVGWELLYFGNGIGRNNNLVDNSEDLLETGVTFGFTVNR